MNIKYINIICGLVVLGTMVLQSCKDDESFDVTGATENKVYLNLQAWGPIQTPKNSVWFSVLNTPASSTIINHDEISVKFPVKCTHPATEPIVVKFDTDLVPVTEGYEAFPSGVTVSVDKKELIIPKGAFASTDSIKFSVSKDNLKLLKIAGYMGGVKITSVSNAEASESLSKAYIVVNGDFSNCIDRNTTVPAGAQVSRTGWTAYTESTGANITNLFNGSATSYTNFTANAKLVVDMKSVVNDITGIQLAYSNQTYSLGALKVWTSDTTTDEFDFQGSASFAQAASQYIKFYEKVSARYIRIEATTPLNASGARIGEFYVYK